MSDAAQDRPADRCLPCFTGHHDWCVRDTKLIGMDHSCDCDCRPTDPTADDR